MRYVLLMILSLALSGCGLEPYVAEERPPIQAVARDVMLVTVLDCSGSFTDKMFGGDELGYRFFLKASENLFRDRMGQQDRILISQLSATDRSLLWEGGPATLRRQFGSGSELQRFIEKRSNPGGSRVYAAVADTLEYLQGLPGVKSGDTKLCVLVLSDLLDNSPTQAEDRQRMVDALSKCGQSNICLGFYWVDQSLLTEARQFLNEAGIDGVVEGEFVADPPLPSWRL